MTGPRFLDEPAPPSPVAEVPPPPQVAEAPRLPPSRPALLDPAPDAPTALQPAWAPEALLATPARAGNGFWVASGLLLALTSWAGFTALAWLAEVAANPTILGIGGAIGIGGGLTVAGWGAVGEWRDYRRLRLVDRSRTILADADTPLAASRQAALDWLDRVAERVPEHAAIRRALLDAAATAEVASILRHRVEPTLRAAVRRIGQDAAVEGAALIAISPHASWDGLIAAWKGLVVIRKVASVYGLRPGPAVLASLVRKVAWTAAGTAGVDLLSQTLADQALSSLPVARHVMAALPGGGVAALRLYRLAAITAEACSPVPR